VSTTINVNPQNFPTGQTTIGPANVPVGTTGYILDLDVSSIVSPQLLHYSGEYSTDGGATWLGMGSADFTGPWTDRQGVVHNDAAETFAFGKVASADGSGWVDIVSSVGWKVRAIVTADNGPIHSSGGTLTILP